MPTEPLTSDRFIQQLQALGYSQTEAAHCERGVGRRAISSAESLEVLRGRALETARRFGILGDNHFQREYNMSFGPDILPVPSYISEWCDRYSHTEPEEVDGQWRGFPPNAVMSVPIPTKEKKSWDDTSDALAQALWRTNNITNTTVLTYGDLPAQSDTVLPAADLKEAAYRVARFNLGMAENSGQRAETKIITGNSNRFRLNPLSPNCHGIIEPQCLSNPDWLTQVKSREAELCDRQWGTDPMKLMQYFPDLRLSAIADRLSSSLFELAIVIEDLAWWLKTP